MSSTINFRLSIDSALVNEDAINFRLPHWPPPREFPVVVDGNGVVLSRFGDSVWDLSVWDQIPKKVNFGDGLQRSKHHGKVSVVNADTLRLIDAWWLWGPRGVVVPGTLVSQHRVLKQIFVMCTSEGIDARELSRFPTVVTKIAKAMSPSTRTTSLTLLHSLLEQREKLGFVILDRDALRMFATALAPSADVEQTAYVPPRIWAYQVHRLRTVLDDFHAHEKKIQACYEAILDRYQSSYGSLRAAIGNPKRKPLGETSGVFEQLAKEFGIYELLGRWYQSTNGQRSMPLSALTNYLSLVTRAGLAYLLNFSLMRVQEAWTLRVDCLQIESDKKLGEIATLRGETTKTIIDDQARWITSPAVAVAIDALTAISGWRAKVKEAYGIKPPAGAPFLYEPTCEPWKIGPTGRPTRGMYPHYASMLKDYPKLFDPAELCVTQEDWNIAKLITPTLDEKTFGVGKIWRFAWHQLRRTGCVNMQASGLVSDFSLQYQLKHQTVATSLYYGQGYSEISFNRSAKAEYIRTMYEMMGKELALLLSDRFISPHGEERKQAILKIVSQGDHQRLLTAAASGKVAWRATLLGGCTKSGPCEYGGIDNIVRCGGGDYRAPCADALFDREKALLITRLGLAISKQLEVAEIGSPYQMSLQAQLRATENTLDAISKS